MYHYYTFSKPLYILILNEKATIYLYKNNPQVISLILT